MNIYQWLCVLGIPGLFASLVTLAITQWKQTKAIKAGVQAMLRDRLLQGYRHYLEKGWADYDDRANLENIYVQYHTLGANGVMDDLRTRFLHLPVQREEVANG
jgi:hypothetical protein